MFINDINRLVISFRKKTEELVYFYTVIVTERQKWFTTLATFFNLYIVRISFKSNVNNKSNFFPNIKFKIYVFYVKHFIFYTKRTESVTY